MSLLRIVAAVAACAGSAALVAAPALAGGPFRGLAQGGEYVVSSQVVSDEVVGGGQNVASGGGSYVGDMAAGTAFGAGRDYGYPDLFYNHFTQGHANATNAQMYVSPVPTPPSVGHTFITYQPFQPEEMMYWHTNRYHKYYDNGRGMNHTKVHYYAPPVRTAASNFYWNVLRIPR